MSFLMDVIDTFALPTAVPGETTERFGRRHRIRKQQHMGWEVQVLTVAHLSERRTMWATLPSLSCLPKDKARGFARNLKAGRHPYYTPDWDTNRDNVDF